jgi:hypothetical protein
MPDRMGSDLPAGDTAPSNPPHALARSNDFRLLDAYVQKLLELQAEAAKFNQFNTRHGLHLKSVVPAQAGTQSLPLARTGGQATEIPRFPLSRERRGSEPLHPEHPARLLGMVEPQ